MEGIIKFYNSEKGYGFIMPDNGDKDVFVHRTGIASHSDLIEANNRVKFDTQEGKKGLEAINVKIIE